MSHSTIRRGLIISGVVLVIALFGGWVLNSSPSFQQCIRNSDNAENSSQCPIESTSSFFPRIINYRNCTGVFIDKNDNSITAVSTFLLVIVTAGLIWTAFRQESTTQRQLRAYALVVKSRIDNFGAGKIPHVTVTIQNCGQTPASDFSQWGCMGFDSFPPTGKPPPFTDTNKGSVHVIAPGGEIKSVLKFRPLTQHEVLGILQGEVALYAIGGIVYKDVFGEVRTTEYKLFANKISDIVDGSMAACTDGNKYT